MQPLIRVRLKFWSKIWSRNGLGTFAVRPRACPRPVKTVTREEAHCFNFMDGHAFYRPAMCNSSRVSHVRSHVVDGSDSREGVMQGVVRSGAVAGRVTPGPRTRPGWQKRVMSRAVLAPRRCQKSRKTVKNSRKRVMSESCRCQVSTKAVAKES